MTTLTAAGLHAGLIERARPRHRLALVEAVAPPAPIIALPGRWGGPPRRFGLTVRVEPDLRARLMAVRSRTGQTTQQILHRALRRQLDLC